jgi:hypothetical protein
MAEEQSGSSNEQFVDPASTFVLDARRVDPGRYRSSLRVLQALHDLLLTPKSTAELQKFAKIISELRSPSTHWRLLTDLRS